MKIPYRAEIDGLRAIAVLAVIIYHAEFAIFTENSFQGGYLGVDIFFVISGYLISKIIFAELEKTKDFSFLDFYDRRARRILPALITVILVSFPFAWMYLLPTNFVEYGESIISSLVFLSNAFFYVATTAYSADEAALKPLLHTWSLSVEEQFYVFFPIIFVTLYKWFRKYLFAALAVILFSSLMLADYTSVEHPSAGFFFFPTRIWELMTGGLLALMDLKYGRQNSSPLCRFLPLTGFVLLAGSMIYFDDSTLHPSLYTAIPILGVALIIFFSHKDEIIGRVLGAKPFVWVGLISYSLYLWHFPIFAFARIKDSTPSEYDKMEWIALTFMLSIISYFLVERPFRDLKRVSSKVALLSVAVAMLATLSMSVWIVNNQGLKERMPSFVADADEHKGTWKRLEQNGKECSNRESGFCKFDGEGDLDLFFIGDSHMGTLVYEFVNRAKDYKTFTPIVNGRCPLLLNARRKDLNDNPQERCTYRRNENIFELLLASKPSVIVLQNNMAFYDGRGAFFEFKDKEDSLFKNYVNVIKLLLENGHKVILAYPQPLSTGRVPRMIRAAMPDDVTEIDEYLSTYPFSITTSDFTEETNKAFDAFDSIKNDNLYRVYPHKIFCDSFLPDHCVVTDGVNILYSDKTHLTEYGSSLVNEKIVEKIRLIESGQKDRVK